MTWVRVWFAGGYKWYGTSWCVYDHSIYPPTAMVQFSQPQLGSVEGVACSRIWVHVAGLFPVSCQRSSGMSLCHCNVTPWNWANINIKSCIVAQFFHNAVECPYGVYECDLWPECLFNSKQGRRQLRLEKLDATRRAAGDSYASACCDCDLWAFDLKTKVVCLLTHVHMRPNFRNCMYS